MSSLSLLLHVLEAGNLPGGTDGLTCEVLVHRPDENGVRVADVSLLPSTGRGAMRVDGLTLRGSSEEGELDFVEICVLREDGSVVGRVTIPIGFGEEDSEKMFEKEEVWNVWYEDFKFC